MTGILQTLSSGTLKVPYMTMTTRAILCEAPVLERDFEPCRIPGGAELWKSGGFFSPGDCFVGYEARCTQTLPLVNGWPIRPGETAVRCVPEGYECNDPAKDQRFATTDYDGTILSAPAFEIRWRDEDLTTRPHPGAQVLGPLPTGPPTPGSSTSFDPISSTADSLPSGLDATGAPPLSSLEPLSGPRFALSAGAVAGIAVGSSLGLMAIIMITLFLTFRHRKRRLDSLDRLSGIDRQDGRQESTHVSAVVPVELENKPVEPRELSSDAQLPCEKPAMEGQEGPRLGSGMHPISVNRDPVEMAGDLAPLSEELSHRAADGARLCRAVAGHVETQPDGPNVQAGE